MSFRKPGPPVLQCETLKSWEIYGTILVPNAFSMFHAEEAGRPGSQIHVCDI